MNADPSGVHCGDQLGLQRETVVRLLKNYADDFRSFGILRFETGEIASRSVTVNCLRWSQGRLRRWLQRKPGVAVSKCVVSMKSLGPPLLSALIRIARIWLHGGYTDPRKQNANPEGLA